eukprot:6459062-Pyramimonas_sp.AAC.1
MAAVGAAATGLAVAARAAFAPSLVPAAPLPRAGGRGFPWHARGAGGTPLRHAREIPVIPPGECGGATG